MSGRSDFDGCHQGWNPALRQDLGLQRQYSSAMVLSVVACLFEFLQRARSVQKTVSCLGRHALGGAKLKFDSNKCISKVFQKLPIQFRQRSRLSLSIQPETFRRISATWRREQHGGPENSRPLTRRTESVRRDSSSRRLKSFR